MNWENKERWNKSDESSELEWTKMKDRFAVVVVVFLLVVSLFQIQKW
jgi:hypothetical protein